NRQQSVTAALLGSSHHPPARKPVLRAPLAQLSLWPISPRAPFALQASTQVRAVKCSDCGISTYAPQNSSQSCNQCPFGSAQPLQGQTFCVFCSAGKFGTGSNCQT